METHPVKNHLSLINDRLTNLSKKIHLSKPQIILLSVFPMIIILGQLMSYFSPDETIHNYFTSRGNLVNRFFVKQGWFWTLFTYFNIIYSKIKNRIVQRKVILISILRVSLITICWLLFTQWFFGPPLMDRIFVLTGGQCTNIQESSIPLSLKNLFEISSNKNGLAENLLTSKSISSASCKRMKGCWEGGHDPSGHVFLLTLSTSLLILESIELYTSEDNLLEALLNKNLSWNQIIIHPTMLTLVVVVSGLSMLLMTIIKYHSFNEQITGLSVALVVIWAVNVVIKVLV